MHKTKTTQNSLIPHYERPLSSHRQPLAIVQYSNAAPSLSLENGILNLTIPYTHTQHREYWSAASVDPAQNSRIESHINGKSGWSADGENFFAAYLVADQDELANASQEAYTDLIKLAHAQGYTNIYRIWNYIGRINSPNINGLERYRDFCVGRAKAFEALNYAPSTLPAATGIGFEKGGVAIFLIARKNPQAVNIENALQVPAYQYPQHYGPKSPSFARATRIETQDAAYLYVSGTASIRQHTSLTDSLEQQISITIENIQKLLETAQENAKHPQKYHCESLKIYVRHPQDAARVSAAFQKAFGITANNAPVFISDICRSELSIEVEGVFRF